MDMSFSETEKKIPQNDNHSLGQEGSEQFKKQFLLSYIYFLNSQVVQSVVILIETFFFFVEKLSSCGTQ